MIRRDFLKLILWIIPASMLQHLAGLPVFAKEGVGGKQASRHTKRLIRGIPSLCLLCPARCGIIGFLEGDKLVKIGGNPKHPNNLGKLCARGLAGMNMQYDPERLTSPMMRRGERGKGQWEKVSWERAYAEIASRLKDIHGSGKIGDFVFHSERAPEGLVKRFLTVFEKVLLLDDDSLNFGNRNCGQWLTWGEPRGVPDVGNSQYILNFGSNPYEAHEYYAGFVGRLIEARVRNKAKLVSFDVRLSYTAGNSDEWFPINPGTDGIVALAMAYVILQNNLHDQAFIQRWTNTSVPKLAEALSYYTPERAQEVSGVHASDIERIAKEFAVRKRAVAITGRGLNGHSNGVYNERCVFLLNTLVGSIDVPGGYCLPRTYNLNDRDLKSFPPRSEGFPFGSEGTPLTPQMFISWIRRGKISPKLYFIHEANPLYTNPETGVVLEVLRDEKKVPFIVVADSYLTETAAYADLVLPVTTYLESWGLDSSPALDMVPFVALQQPIVRPQRNCASLSDICVELAHRVGRGLHRYFRFSSMEEYLKWVVSEFEKLNQAGGFDYLKEHGVWMDSKADPEYRSYERKRWSTPSGKIEIYSERLKRKGFNPYPCFEPIPGHGDLKGKFVLVAYEPNVMGTRTANFPWLAEIKHHNPVWINRDVAKQLHIEEGDRVKVSTRLGSFVTQARLTFGLHPRVVALERNHGHWGYGSIAQAKRFHSKDPNTSLVWWEKEGNGISPNGVIYGDSDPIGGGEAWNDTLVVISKV